MSALKSLAVLAAGVVLGAGVLIAYRIAQETDKPLQEALADVPAELERLYAELRAKGAEAFEKARTACEQGQEEAADVGEGSGAAQQ